MKTTLNLIRAKSPCSDGWQKLLSHLGKTRADNEEVPILSILESNGIEDAIWCLRAVPDREREIRLFAVWCARQVQKPTADPRSLKALEVAEDFAWGRASVEELRKAAYAAAAYAAAAYAADADAYAAAADVAAYAAADAAAYDAAYAAAAAAAYDANAAARAHLRSTQVTQLRLICEACK